MRRRRAHAIRLIETAYELSLDRHDWLTELMWAAGAEIDGSLGMAAFTYVVENGRFRIEELVTDGNGRPGERYWIDGLHRLAPKRFTDRLYRTRPGCGTLSFMVPEFLESPVFRAIFHPLGARDLMGITAIDIADAGVAFGAPLPERRDIDLAADSRWARLGAHINAAARLRRSLRRRSVLDEAEAIFEVDARLAHARGPAREPNLRQALRALVVAQDRMRARADDDEALDLWQALALGRWSLVDRFDTDGRRYVVACANPPEVDDPRQLTPRERQVAHLAGLGFSDKLVGYHLGLSESAVSTALTAVRRKLALESRVHLVELIAAARGVAPLHLPPTP